MICREELKTSERWIVWKIQIQNKFHVWNDWETYDTLNAAQAARKRITNAYKHSRIVECHYKVIQ